MSATAALVACCGVAFAGGPNEGPDVICGELTDVNHYGPVTVGGEVIHAFAVGTTSCNKGNQPADWIDGTPNHPVISQTIWRYDGNRLTQVGIGFVKHSFAALQNNACGFGCSNNGSFSSLGSGCSDPYGASLNGSHSDLGPRSEINAFTGFFTYPYSSQGSGGNAIYKRIQVKESDINTAHDYFVEGAYVIKDDVPFGNQFNNVSWRPMRHTGTSRLLDTTGSTVREQPVIYAWQLEDPSVSIDEVNVPGEGRFVVASKAVDLGNGSWRYEYGVYNQNSHRSAASFSVPASGTSNHGFHDVFYHDSVDANIDGTDWTATEGAGSLTFSTDVEAVNTNANAIRWGTMYNFWFESDSAPTTGDAEIGLFRSGSPASVMASVVMPEAASCEADLTGDGALDIFDVFAFLDLFNGGDLAADITGDGTLDIFDVFAYLDLFNAGCA